MRVGAFPVRVHGSANLSIDEFEDKLVLRLTHEITGKTSERNYFKLETGIDLQEAVKIDTIIYHMHNEIGLNLWDFPIT